MPIVLRITRSASGDVVSVRRYNRTVHEHADGTEFVVIDGAEMRGNWAKSYVGGLRVYFVIGDNCVNMGFGGNLLCGDVEDQLFDKPWIHA